MGNILVLIMMFGWIPVAIGLFAVMSPRRAVLAVFLGAWLFLPMASFKVAEGIPAYDKVLAMNVGVLLGAMLFDCAGLMAFRPTWWDLPMAVWCLCPLASSISNDLGIWDGLSAGFAQTMTWGLPYLIGRVYFRDLTDLRELATGVFLGGLVYVPFCLWESRMSPHLNRTIYGFLQHGVAQIFSYRWGGWRPVVFMQHGLAVGMWMAMAAFLGIWLWYSRAIPRIWRGMPTIWFVLALFLTAILCRSLGALILLAAGLGSLILAPLLRTRLPLWLLLAAAPVAMLARTTGMWDGRSLVDVTSNYVNSERAQSLDFRRENEEKLIAKAKQRPVFGWGKWGRARVYDEDGADISVTDGLWIITMGDNGIAGLGSLTLAMLLPAGLILWRCPVSAWRDPGMAPAIVLAVVIVLYWIDCIPNGMVNPIFMLAAGGVAGLSGTSRSWVNARKGPSPRSAKAALATTAHIWTA